MIQICFLRARCTSRDGYLAAYVQLANCYESGVGVEHYEVEAVRLFRFAEDRGDASAKGYLGCCYHVGRGVRKNLSKAVNLYRMAAEQGDVHAQYNFACCYDNGSGIGNIFTPRPYVGGEVLQSKGTTIHSISLVDVKHNGLTKTMLSTRKGVLESSFLMALTYFASFLFTKSFLVLLSVNYVK